MSNKHKNPTISFRITDAERKQIEARILASGMMKKRLLYPFLHLQPHLRCRQERNHISIATNCQRTVPTIT